MRARMSASQSEYRACTNADFGDSAIQSDVLDLYRRLHGGPKLGQPRRSSI